jgi:hypothetical protein
LAFHTQGRTQIDGVSDPVLKGKFGSMTKKVMRGWRKFFRIGLLRSSIYFSLATFILIINSNKLQCAGYVTCI